MKNVPESNLVSNLPNDNGVFQEVIAEFVEHLKDKLVTMHEAYEEQNWDLLQDLAHWLKGSGGTAGFPALTEPAKNLEQAAQSHQGQTVGECLAKVSELTASIFVEPLSITKG